MAELINHRKEKKKAKNYSQIRERQMDNNKQIDERKID